MKNLFPQRNLMLNPERPGMPDIDCNVVILVFFQNLQMNIS